jgi:hypothetical protein
VFRRVEWHGREESSPWSIRQTGVYHRLSISPSATAMECSSPGGFAIPRQSRYLIISPSIAIDTLLVESAKTESACYWNCKEAIDPWKLHRSVVSEGLRNWTTYLVWIESQLRELVGIILSLRCRPLQFSIR